jgi:hypothetical protein
MYPKYLPGDRSQKLTLNDAELAVAGTIFEGHVMDAPTHLEVSFYGNYKGSSAPQGPQRDELLMFGVTSADDIKSSYIMRYKPDSDEPVTASKEILKISESAIPYEVAEGISSPAVNVERIKDEKYFEPYEQAALAELVESLRASQASLSK